MFLKAILVFSFLVLYTASVPISERNKCRQGTGELKHILEQKRINCSNSFIQKINFTQTSNLYANHQYMFCQISKALNHSVCKEPEMRQLQSLSHQMQGNATCILWKSGVTINLEDFLNNLKEYITSLSTLCPNK